MAEMVDELKARQPSAWDRACDKLAPRLYAFILHLVRRDQRLAEELHQEVWLAAVDGIDGFDPQRGDFSAWLFAIARNVVVNHYRRAARQSREQPFEAYSNSALPHFDGALPPDILEMLERVDVVRAALLALSDDQRDVLNRKYLCGLSVNQIAQQMNRSPKAVESLLTRSRQKLRGLVRWYFGAPQQERGEK
jgi:RNA polymerase sigma-70 factor (ECF subfamily)